MFFAGVTVELTRLRAQDVVLLTVGGNTEITLVTADGRCVRLVAIDGEYAFAAGRMTSLAAATGSARWESA